MISPLIAARPGGADIRPATSGPAIEVAPDLWLSEGLSNSYLWCTGEGRVVVNTGMGFEGPSHRRRYDEVSGAPIRAVVFTQGHVDHVGGTGSFADADMVIAQSANPRCQADDARIHRFRVKRSAIFWAEAVAAADEWFRSQPGGGVSSAQAAPTPTLTFDERLAVAFGDDPDDHAQLIAVPGGETIDSLVVWMAERGIVLIGNLCSALFGHIPNLVTLRGDRTRDPLAFVDSVQRVIDLDAELLCTGHFSPISGAANVRIELERVRDATVWLHDAVVDAMNSGQTVYEAMASIRLPDNLEVGQAYGKVAWDVRAIWEGYAGWFHHRSTTELYAVSPLSIAPDLVELAGGSTAIIARAAGHVAADRPTEALHLLEIAIATDGEDPTAWVVWRDAHELLLDHAIATEGNFWEIGWLRNQISRADHRISRASR